MASMQSLADRRVDLYQMKPELLQVDPMDGLDRDPSPDLEAEDRRLTDSIKELGVLEALTVYMKDGVPTIVNGRRRLRCVLQAISEGAEIKTIPVRVEEKGYNDADRIVSAITRNTGRPYTPLELSRKVVQLSVMGWGVNEIAKKLSFSRTYIDNLIVMAAAPQEVKTLISEGKVAPATAMKVLKNEGDKKGTQMLKDAVKQQAATGKVKVTEKHIKPTAPAPAPVKRDKHVPSMPSADTVLIGKVDYAALLAKSKLLTNALNFLGDLIANESLKGDDLARLRAVALHGELSKAIYGEAP